MFPHRSLRFPITLAVVMIVLVVGLVVGWVLMAIFWAQADTRLSGTFWTFLSLGSVFFVMLLAGVVLYLIWSIGMIGLNRRQSNFLDSVTHELKSPIASLKLCLQTLTRRKLSPDQEAGFYRFMFEDIERLDEMIDHALDAARLEGPPPNPDDEVVDLSALLGECTQTVCDRYQVSPDVVRLEVQPCRINACRNDLALICRNLLDNAVKYAGQPPKVTVTLRKHGERHVVVCVADNGPGIPRKQRRRVFSRFVRLGNELERLKPGTGLGLYLVRELVKRNRGQICVRDGSNGEGTVMELRLPGAAPASVAVDDALSPVAEPKTEVAR